MAEAPGQVGEPRESSQTGPCPRCWMWVQGLCWAQLIGRRWTSVGLWAAAGEVLDPQKAPPCAPSHHPPNPAKLLDLSQPWARGKAGDESTWPLPDRLLTVSTMS